MGWNSRGKSKTLRQPSFRSPLRLHIPTVYVDSIGFFIIIRVNGGFFRQYLCFFIRRNSYSTTTGHGQTVNKPPKPDPHQVLGVSKSATMDEITKAYRKKAMENHPDTLPNKTPESIALAEQRTQEIIEAYNFFKLSVSKN